MLQIQQSKSSAEINFQWQKTAKKQETLTMEKPEPENNYQFCPKGDLSTIRITICDCYSPVALCAVCFFVLSVSLSRCIMLPASIFSSELKQSALCMAGYRRWRLAYRNMLSLLLLCEAAKQSALQRLTHQSVSGVLYIPKLIVCSDDEVIHMTFHNLQHSWLLPWLAGVDYWDRKTSTQH